jgi:hypothetical protein
MESLKIRVTADTNGLDERLEYLDRLKAFHGNVDKT